MGGSLLSHIGRVVGKILQRMGPIIRNLLHGRAKHRRRDEVDAHIKDLSGGKQKGVEGGKGALCLAVGQSRLIMIIILRFS